MLGFAAIRDYVHTVESVFKSPPQSWTQPLLDRLFEGAATLRRAVEQVGTAEEGSALARLASLPPPASAAEIDAVAEAAPAGEVREEPQPVGSSTEFLRVPFPKLDALANLVGDLFAIHSVLDDLLRAQRSTLEAAGLRRPLQMHFARLERTADALRNATMDLRLVPVGRVFGRFPSLVRELAREREKQIQVVIEGEDTELDKSTVDALGEPLLHLVQNAVHHGIGTPEERAAAGKPPQGTITLRAAQSGDRVRIEVEDDGTGLDRTLILERARAARLVGPKEELSDEEIASLIFLPGFSTRREVDTGAGRGIGMDAVASSIARLRGSVEVEDVPGSGTCFVVQLPLTLAIIPALLFESAGETLALPTLEVEDAHRPAEVAQVAGGEVIVHADEMIPLARPERLFAWDDAPLGAGAGEPAVIPRFVVVVRRGARAAAIAADRLLEQRDLVVKALPAFLGQPPGVSGATIAPDGRIVLLLDAGGIIDLNLAQNRRSGRGAQTPKDPDR
jgi:two-component system, chemotaxis family, sensor kinase CheA